MTSKLIAPTSYVALLALAIACSTTDSIDDAPTGDGDGGAQGDGDGDGDGDHTAGGAGADCGGAAPIDEDDLGECVPYSPASFSGQTSGNFVATSDLVRIPLRETDFGGGLLTVTYSQAGPVTASLFLAEGSEPEVPRVETTAFGPGVTDEEPAVVVYRLAGNRSYELGIASFVFDENKPSYSVSYEYQPLEDCYEENDTFKTAKRIPLNTTIKAHHHTGIVDDDTSFVSASGDDWYTFELEKEMKVKLKGVLPGKDGADGGNSSIFSIYESDGVTLADCPGDGAFETDPVSDTEKVETCEATLKKGKYFVALTHFASQWSHTAVNEPFNESWDTEYSLLIQAH